MSLEVEKEWPPHPKVVPSNEKYSYNTSLRTMYGGFIFGSK